MNELCEEGLHYCPNCDRSIDVSTHQQAMQGLESRVKELEYGRDNLVELIRDRDSLRVRAERLQAEVERLKDENATLRAEHLSNCLFHRCSTHLATPQINKTEYTGAECGACIAEDRDGIAKAAHELRRDLEGIGKALQFEQALTEHLKQQLADQRAAMQGLVGEIDLLKREPVRMELEAVAHANNELRKENERLEKWASQVRETNLKVCDERDRLQARVEELKKGLSISTRSVMSENDKLLAEVERAWSVIEGSGVPKERAKTITGGIMVLQQRMNKESHLQVQQLADLRAENEQLKVEALELKQACGLSKDFECSHSEIVSTIRSQLFDIVDLDCRHPRICLNQNAECEWCRSIATQQAAMQGLVEAIKHSYNTFTQVAMLIDGWNATEAEWGEYDRSVRTMVTDSMTQANAALAAAEKFVK